MGVLHPLNKMKKSQLRHIIRESIKQLMNEQTEKYRCGHCDTPCTQFVIDNNSLGWSGGFNSWYNGAPTTSICMFSSSQECHDFCDENTNLMNAKRCIYDKFGNATGCKKCTSYELTYHPAYRYQPSIGEEDPAIRCTPGSAVPPPGTIPAIAGGCSQSMSACTGPNPGLGLDKYQKTHQVDNPQGPFTTDNPQSIVEPDDEITRMQKIANIKK